MKLKSISGVSYRVKDVDVTADFYQRLGFRAGKKDEVSTSIYLNWFWIEFYESDRESTPDYNQAGKQTASAPEVFLYISVDDLAVAYQELQEMGLNPSAELVNKAKGRKEIKISDPDGYPLVFFQKK